MPERDADRIRETIEDQVDRALDAEPTGVFSRSEVLDAICAQLGRWQDDTRSEFLTLHRKGYISRRKFLKLLGIGVGGSFVAASGVGWFMGQKIYDERDDPSPTGYAGSQEPSFSFSNTVTLDVDPNGGSLDDALRSNAQDGTLIEVPQGEYTLDSFDASGLRDFGIRGKGQQCPRITVESGGTHNFFFSVDGQDMLIERLLFDTGPGTDRGGTFRARATGGTVVCRDITKLGMHPDRTAGFRCNTADGARLVMQNARAMGGTEEGTGSVGTWVAGGNDGTVVLRNHQLGNFTNNGVYFSDKGTGTVQIEGGFYHNNNIDAVRLHEPGDSVRDITILIDGSAPSMDGGTPLMRGIWYKNPRGDHVVENADIVMGDVSGAGLALIAGGSGGGGVFRDSRIRNDTGSGPVAARMDGWSAENIHLTGSGSKEIDNMSTSNICRGSDCDTPSIRDPGDCCGYR